MPATAELLKRLQETLGEEATRDLVTWIDQGWEYQIAQLRELADLHYSRFDARLEQRLAEVRAALRTEMAQGLAAVRQDMAQGLAALRAEMAQGDAALRAEIAALRTDMAAQRADLIKWMFIFWAGTVIPIAGLVIALVKL
jgi:hypothetical protein